MRREVVLFAQQHRQAAPGGIARNARSVDAAAHDEQVVQSALRHFALSRSSKRKSDETLMFEFEI
jgi:hypothetical protein